MTVLQTMFRVFWILVLVTAVTITFFDAVGLFRKWRNKRKQLTLEDLYFKEPRIKIMFNPFENKMQWVMLNPKNHVWEWREDATADEISRWDEFRTDQEKQDGIPYCYGDDER